MQNFGCVCRACVCLHPCLTCVILVLVAPKAADVVFSCREIHTLPFQSSCCFTGCKSLFSSLDPHSFISSASQLRLDPMRSELPRRELWSSDCTSCQLFANWRDFFFIIFCKNFDLFPDQNSARFIFFEIFFLLFFITTIFISFKRTRRTCETARLSSDRRSAETRRASRL